MLKMLPMNACHLVMFSNGSPSVPSRYFCADAANADAISSCFLGQLTAGVLLTPLCFRETDFSLPVMAAVFALGVIQVGGAYILLSIGIRKTPPVTASLITGL